MHLKVDSRETSQDLFNALDIIGHDRGFTWEKTYLEVGDVACGNIIIERKGASDFVSSIMDGRLKSQSVKMGLNYEYKYVIVEGDPYTVSSNVHPNVIIGQQTSLAVKYNIKLIFVKDTVDFVYACYSIIKKHIEEDQFNPNDFKKLAIKVTSEDIVTAMIVQIPNVGYDKARTIAEKYGYSLKTLVNNITEADLLTIEGIGDVTAKNIVETITK